MSRENNIIIDVGSEKRSINPMIYSNFIEHLGECIHNGLWAYDPVNVPLFKGNQKLIGMREDVFNAIKNLKPTVLRAFGGCYSDVYHWKDAIGPSRKTVKNIAWNDPKLFPEGTGPDIANQFGTDEFLILCEKVGAKPYLNVNYGTGSPEEAADWVEYCNCSTDTEHGVLRAKYGRKEPYNVQFWGIANEIYGFWERGYEKKPENYAKKYLQFAKKMREKDPSIKLVACGYENSKWNQTLLKNIGEEWVDYLSIHRYFPYLFAMVSGEKHPDDQRCYHALMASAPLIEDYINTTWEDIVTALGKDTHVRIAFDEWGVWYVFKDVIKSNYNLQDGIWTALVLTTFQKMSDKCPMANWAQIINTIGTIQTDPDGLILTPIYLAIKLLVDHTYNNLLENIKIKCETFDTRRYGRIPKSENVPYIDCNATINDKGDGLSIMIINKHFTDNLSLNLELKNFNPSQQGEIIELNSQSPFDYNTIENRNKIKLEHREIDECKSKMNLELPAHSVIILKLKKK
ncbi:MAG: alpha-L-arabinofuranosidase C-terminal domain-containing protein [Promethearchaeota archaeon]